MDVLKLTDAQQSIFDSIVYNIKNGNGRYDCVIQGYAGTGKSTTISSIISTLSKKGYSIAVTSPTHKANQVLRTMLRDRTSSPPDVMTIHSFLGLKLVQKKQEQVLEHDPHSPNARRLVDVLIIDEASMISTEMYLHIIKQAHRVRCAIIFLGDDAQLPPVEPEKEVTIISNAFDHGTKYQLTEVLRQALENPIIALATDVRGCIGDPTALPAIDFLRKVPESDHIMRVSSEFDVVETYYQMLLHETDDDMKNIFENTYKYKIISYMNKTVDRYNSMVRSIVVPDQEDEFVKGEPLVMEESTLSCMYANQQQFRCPTVHKDMWLGINCWRMDSPDGTAIYVVGPESKHQYQQHLQNLVTKINLKEINPFTKKPYSWGDYYIIKEKICVVGYPYATTIHRSQGSTFRTAWLDSTGVGLVSDKDDQARMLYTAVTRPSEYLILKL